MVTKQRNKKIINYAHLGITLLICMIETQNWYQIIGMMMYLKQMNAILTTNCLWSYLKLPWQQSYAL